MEINGKLKNTKKYGNGGKKLPMIIEINLLKR